MALGGCAMAQSISWIEMDNPTGTNAYLPKLAGDGNGYFVLVGQDTTGTGEMLYQTGWTPSEMPASSVSWNAAQTLATGSGPSVAAATLFGQGDPSYEAAVEIHRAGKGTSAALLSRVALWPQADPPTAMPATLIWSDDHQLGQGFNPSVSLDILHWWEDTPDSATVVEVHQAESGMSDLWYRVGTLHVNTTTGTADLNWGSAYQFDNGYAPSVSVCEGLAVEVHEGDSGTLWYAYGAVDLTTNTISWSTSVQYDTGYRPSVSTCGNVFDAHGRPYSTPHYYLAEVHQANNPASGESSPLLYQVAPYGSTGVTWGTAANYDSGCYPTLAILYGVAEANYFPTYAAEAHAPTCGAAAAPVNYDLGSLSLPDDGR
jgi:hypothetical protein